MKAATAVAAPRLVRRNYGRGHGYRLDGVKVAGVTSVIDNLDKAALRNWYAEQAAARAVDHWDELAQQPVSARLEFIKNGPRDKVRAAALRGTQIHTLGQALAEGGEADVPPEHRGPVEAYARWLDKWDVEPLWAETPVAHTAHRYAGTADLWGRVGKRDGALCLLDIKTGKGVYDETALQLAAYRYTDLMVVAGEDGKPMEAVTPAADLVYCAHVQPDDVRMLPIVADEGTWRSFLYLLQVHVARQDWKDFPLIGEAEQP